MRVDCLPRCPLTAPSSGQPALPLRSLPLLAAPPLLAAADSLVVQLLLARCPFAAVLLLAFPRFHQLGDGGSAIGRADQHRDLHFLTSELSYLPLAPLALLVLKLALPGGNLLSPPMLPSSVPLSWASSFSGTSASTDMRLIFT